MDILRDFGPTGPVEWETTNHGYDSDGVLYLEFRSNRTGETLHVPMEA